MLTVTKEDDWTFSGRNSGQSTTTFSMTIQFCDDDAPHVDSFAEGISLVITLLSNGTVHYEDNFIGTNSFLNLFHLVEQFSLLLMST
jgi:hypothetical protein